MEKIIYSRTNASYVQLSIVMKNHLHIDVAQADMQKNIIVASSFMTVEQATEFRDFLNKFIEYDGRED